MIRIPIRWTASQAVDLAGYRVYYGPSIPAGADRPESMVAVGLLVPDVKGNVHYTLELPATMNKGVFCVTAYDIAGGEGTPAGPVTWSVPAKIMGLKVMGLVLGR